ncbi:hypothetical protein NBRC116188_03780 [Oceaniserpentilla sp. 4NH20-0058]|uniref:DUF6586 family protein n=1 Tax=Oceaniserpentilla sp. 4NH20-0058 TaxID=3127660 RepID=UPI0031041388
MSAVSRTNQVVFFARSCLAQAEQAAGQDKRQLEEGALSHLYTGVVSFANELVGQYRLAPFEDIKELFMRTDLPAELYELALLQQDSSSWIAALLKQYQRMLLTGLDDGVVTHSAQLISSQSDYVSLMRNWLIELEKTIQRMRLHYQEN